MTCMEPARLLVSETLQQLHIQAASGLGVSSLPGKTVGEEPGRLRYLSSREQYSPAVLRAAQTCALFGTLVKV